MVSAKAQEDLTQRIELSRALAAEIDHSSARRRSVPVRSVFARDMTGQHAAPMAKLVAIGGRGGEVLLKLYLALIWRSSGEPFSTAIPARKWAELLALPEPSTNGARRVTDAVKTLQEHNLIAVEHRRGDPSVITLLHESGHGQPYFIPRGGNDDRYFHIPAKMWVSGQLQRLTAPGLAVLMAVLSEQSQPGAPVWWSTTRFAGRFGVSPATRARGTRELRAAGLLAVTRRSVTTSPGKSFAAERVRNVYMVAGEARLEPATQQQVKAKPRRAVTTVKMPAKDKAGV